MSDPALYQSEARGVERSHRAVPRDNDVRQTQLPTDGPRLQRRRRTSNPFEFDKRLIPPGFSYEWKTEAIYGQPQTDHVIDIRENHWTPVPASRHPELAMKGDSVIRRGGTVLHERPDYLTDEARMEDIREAMRPVQQKEELMYGTPPGQLPRDHPSVRRASYVTQQYAPGDPIEQSRDGSMSEP